MVSLRTTGWPKLLGLNVGGLVLRGFTVERLKELLMLSAGGGVTMTL